MTRPAVQPLPVIASLIAVSTLLVGVVMAYEASPHRVSTAVTLNGDATAAAFSQLLPAAHDLQADVQADLQAARPDPFTQPGWRSLGSGGGYLGGNRRNGSYASYLAPGKAGWSTVVETLGARGKQTLTLTVTGGLPGGPVHVWSGHPFRHGRPGALVRGADLREQHGRYRLTLLPGRLYEVTTADRLSLSVRPAAVPGTGTDAGAAGARTGAGAGTAAGGRTASRPTGAVLPSDAPTPAAGPAARPTAAPAPPSAGASAPAPRPDGRPDDPLASAAVGAPPVVGLASAPAALAGAFGHGASQLGPEGATGR